MNEQTRGKGSGPSQHQVEIGATIAMALFGLIIIGGSIQVGIGWGAEGPKSGFFPFYLGVAIVGASAINLMAALASRSDRLFAEWGQLRQVMAVVIPSTIYVAIIPWTGIYISSVLLIAVFMIWLGRYSVQFSAFIAVAVIVATYLTFEKWFLVPLPKGPIEDYFGL